MNSTQALTRLRKVLGKTAAVQDHRRATSPESREAARAVMNAAFERKRTAEAAMIARREELLAADAEYQRLRAEYLDAKQAHGNTPWPERYRYEAGTISGVGGLSFFHLDAQADSLAELVEKVEAKHKAAA